MNPLSPVVGEIMGTPHWSNLLTSWLLAFVPCLIYPVMGILYWNVIKWKKQNIREILDKDRAKLLYPSLYAASSGASQDPFLTLFNITFNAVAYTVAITANVVIVLAATVVCLGSAHFPLGLPAFLVKDLEKVPPAVVSGMAGAYAFGLFEILRGFRSNDLSPISFNLIWLRLIVVAFLSAVAGQVLKEGYSSVVSFGMGVFPLALLFEWTRKAAEKQMGTLATTIESEPPTLPKLQGMTRRVIERFEDEDIDSTQKLAMADPIKLFLKMNLEWKTILDFIDQAFLYNYIGDRIVKLRPLGIRCSLELIDLWEFLGQEPGTLEIVNKPETTIQPTMLHTVAAALDQDVRSTQWLLRTLSMDPQIRVIRDLWSDTA